MIRKALLIAMVWGVQAHACPDLTGEYYCSNSSGEQYEESIVVRQENGVTVYSSKGDDIYTDNQEREIDDGEMKGSYIARCENNEVVVDIKADLVDSGRAVGKIEITGVLKPTSTGYDNEISGQISIQGLSQSIDNFDRCVKQN